MPGNSAYNLDCMYFTARENVFFAAPRVRPLNALLYTAGFEILPASSASMGAELRTELTRADSRPDL